MVKLFGIKDNVNDMGSKFWTKNEASLMIDQTSLGFLDRVVLELTDEKNLDSMLTYQFL